MPHIPIPPKPGAQPQTLSQFGNIGVQIKDIAEQQARMVLDEWMKGHGDLFDSKERKLRIQNPQNLIGYSINPYFSVIGVIEEDKWYQFNLGNSTTLQTEIILLHRRQTDSGHYIMEYNGKTLWVTKDEIDTPEKIAVCMNTI